VFGGLALGVVAKPVAQPQPHHRFVGLVLVGRQAGLRVDQLQPVVKILLDRGVEGPRPS